MKVVGEGLMGKFAQVKPCRGSSPNAIWDRLYRRISRPVDGSARAPTKGVPSCEKPGGGARSLRTRDSRMGYPVPSGTLPYGSGNAGKGNICVPAGKESKRDAVSRGDRKRHSPNRTSGGNSGWMWCCRTLPNAVERSRSGLERPAVEGDSPVGVSSTVTRRGILSTVGWNSRGKLGVINPQG